MTSWKGVLGNEMHLIRGKGDHVFVVDAGDEDHNGDPRTIMISLQAMRDFIKEVDGICGCEESAENFK